MITLIFGIMVLILVTILISNIEKHFENSFGKKTKSKLELENKKIKLANSFKEVEEIEKRIIKLKREKIKSKLPLIFFSICIYSLMYYWFYVSGYRQIILVILFTIIFKIFYKKYFLNT